MEGVGARLKKIRLEKGLTLEEVQKKTKLHLNILKAIEDDSLVGVSPVYIRGFLKIYCKLLGVEPREFILDYKQPQVKADGISEKAPAQSAVRKFSVNLPRIKLKTVFIICVVALAVLGVFKVLKLISARKQAPLIHKLTLPQAVPQKTEKKKARAEKTALTLTGNTIKLGIHAKDNCYFTLKADGHTLFQGLFRKGFSESWQAKEKMEFSVNNAAAVSLEINGRTISDLGRRHQAVKGIVTKDGGLNILH